MRLVQPAVYEHENQRWVNFADLAETLCMSETAVVENYWPLAVKDNLTRIQVCLNGTATDLEVEEFELHILGDEEMFITEEWAKMVLSVSARGFKRIEFRFLHPSEEVDFKWSDSYFLFKSNNLIAIGIGVR